MKKLSVRKFKNTQSDRLVSALQHHLPRHTEQVSIQILVLPVIILAAVTKLLFGDLLQERDLKIPKNCPMKWSRSSFFHVIASHFDDSQRLSAGPARPLIAVFEHAIARNTLDRLQILLRMIFQNGFSSLIISCLRYACHYCD